MAEAPEFKLRTFREGDEHALAHLFNATAAGFMGPIRVTAKSWREQYRRRSWTGPSLTEDRSSCRIAERRGRILGYAVTDYQPQWMDEAAVVQELCVVEEDGAEELMEALLSDAEERALSKGRSYVLLYLSAEDGRLEPVKDRLGYHEEEESGVFMASVLDLPHFLEEIEPALTARLEESRMGEWQGAVRMICGEQSAALVCREGKVRVTARVSRAKITAKVQEAALPLLLLGRQSVGELYIQDLIAVRTSDKMEALRLLDALFPRIPLFLPRAQWW